MADAPPALTRQNTSLADDGPSIDPPGSSSAAGASSSSSAAAASPPPAAAAYKVSIGGITDPGVHGKQNQDDFFAESLAGEGNAIIGVFDGHGRELGQLAARTAKAYIRDELKRAEVLARVESDPKGAFVELFAAAHKAIESAFSTYYRDAGWVVSTSPGGFLTRQRAHGAPVMCVHGGTTATVLVIFGGRRAVVANVGDSSALLCGGSSDVHVMRHISTWPGIATGPAAALDASHVVAKPEANPDTGRGPLQMEMSADHSPESAEEFYRMRSARPSVADASRPELLFVYDTLTSSKMSCPHIFRVDQSSGRAARTNKGSYYKNVRNEWATLVATPPYAQFQDALAFTRSLGDLHLHSYGVSNVPEVRWIEFAPQDAAGVPRPPTSSPLCIAACSDGVWDNWKFHDVAAFVLHPERLKDPSPQNRTVALMTTNLERAHINFGNSADNMTAVCIYLDPLAASSSGATSASSSASSSSFSSSSSSSAAAGSGTGTAASF